jgi:hypothetical protein
MTVSYGSSRVEHDSFVEPAVNRLVLLTGQSIPSNTALSPEQIAFLRAVAPPEVEILAHGFPFLRSRETALYRQPRLLAASLHNAHQYVAARLVPRFQNEIVTRLNELFSQTSATLFVISGSCGLHFMNVSWPHLIRSVRFFLVALGPVSLGHQTVPKDLLVTVRGTRDAWSAVLFRGPIDHHVPGGHLDYWTCATTISLVRSQLAAAFADLRRQ